jgi:hypothetical protein
VQDLGPPGAHPGAEAGGEHDRAESGGIRHGRGRYHNILGIAPRGAGDFLAARSVFPHNRGRI